MTNADPMPALPLAAVVQQLAQRHSLDLTTPGAALVIEAPPHGDLVIAVWDAERRYSIGRTVYRDGYPTADLSLYYGAGWQPLAAFNELAQPLDLATAERDMLDLIDRLYWRKRTAILMQLDGDPGEL